MVTRRRDRHGRGIRGPLARRNPLTGTIVEPPLPLSRQEFFDGAVRSAIERVMSQCPSCLSGVWVGIEEVPYLETAWSGDQVPLAAAVSPAPQTSGRVVLYRRPLEHRAASRAGLQILVFRTLVEQLAALTGLDTEDIDPDGLGEDDDF
jgi:predicted Zn-dependent protease with MMP-like domain